MRKLCVLLAVASMAVSPATVFAAEVPPPTQAHAPLPASLVALEQKQEQLDVASMRFSAQTSVATSSRKPELLKFLKLFLATKISGEETFSPSAGNMTMTLFGHPFKLRVIGKTVYLYVSGRTRQHRPRHIWIRFGRGGLLELFTVNGKHLKLPAIKPSEPPLAEPSFVGLRKLLAGAEEVRELGAGTVLGQPVTNFLAVLEPEQLQREHLASTAQLVSHPQSPIVALETSLASNGLPVQTVVRERQGATTISVTVDIPEINFPLTVQAPPAAQTITVARLRAIERREKRRHETHGRK